MSHCVVSQMVSYSKMSQIVSYSKRAGSDRYRTFLICISYSIKLLCNICYYLDIALNVKRTATPACVMYCIRKYHHAIRLLPIPPGWTKRFSSTRNISLYIILRWSHNKQVCCLLYDIYRVTSGASWCKVIFR